MVQEAKIINFPVARRVPHGPKRLSGKTNVPFFLTSKQIDALKIASGMRVTKGIPKPHPATWNALLRVERGWVTYPVSQRNFKVKDRTYSLTARGKVVVDAIRKLEM